MLREMLIASVIASVAVGVASGVEPTGFMLAQAAPPPAPGAPDTWTLSFLVDGLILGGIGLVGGFLSLIAIPYRNTRDAVIRVLCGGFFSCLFAGAIILWTGLSTSHPSIRCAVAGLSGFLSYPALMWLGQHGLTWALQRMGVSTNINGTNGNTPEGGADAPKS
jgi:hypothetical protein